MEFRGRELCLGKAQCDAGQRLLVAATTGRCHRSVAASVGLVKALGPRDLRPVNFDPGASNCSGAWLVGSFGVCAVSVWLGCQAVAACGATVYFDGVLVGGGVAHMGGLCTFVDLGGLLMSHVGRLIDRGGRPRSDGQIPRVRALPARATSPVGEP